jgi:DNA-binding MarR family transcriptional regulator
VTGKQVRGGQTFLEGLSEELGAVSVRLARYAEEEKQRRQAAARERVTAGQVRAVLAARYARSERMGLDLANPGWSLLLELFRAELEKRPARLARVAADARVPGTTALRWVDALAGAGLVRRDPHPEHEGVYFLALTDAGSEAMEDYFVLLLLGWAEADAPEWSS